MNTPQAAGTPHSVRPTPHFFLKIAEVKGDSRAKGHEGEIDLHEWDWGETQAADLGARKAGGSVSMRDVECTSVTGAASPQLFLHCATGKKFKTAILTCEQHHGQDIHVYLTITLSDVKLASFEIKGTPDRDVPLDSFTLKFTKIEFKYIPRKGDGTTGGNFTSTWDLSTNEA